jgi:hypothetical protein
MKKTDKIGWLVWIGVYVYATAWKLRHRRCLWCGQRRNASTYVDEIVCDNMYHDAPTATRHYSVPIREKNGNQEGVTK